MKRIGFIVLLCHENKEKQENAVIKKAILIVIILNISILFSSAPAQDGIQPRLNLEPGTSYICTMDMTRHIMQTTGGDNQVMEQDLLLEWDYKILSKKDNGNYEISARYDRVKSSQTFGMQKVEFDSDSMPDYIDPSMIGYKHMVGSELKMEITPEGRVKKLDGFQEILDKIIEELNIPDSPERNQIINNLRGQFGDEAMRQSFEQITSFYPEEPVNTGDQWHSESAMDVGFPIVVDSDYKLLSRENGMAEIDVAATVHSNPGSDNIDMGSFSLTYIIDGTQNGRITLDESSGLPVSSDITQQFTGTVSVSDAPDLEDRSWPVAANGRIAITFKKQ